MQPITLCTFSSKEAAYVFAASNRPTVIYSSNKKLLYGNINLEEVSHMCPFNLAAFPDSLAIAKEDELTIGTFDEIQKLCIRSRPLEGFARCISHQEETHTFAICSVYRNEDDPETLVQLLDDQTFKPISAHTLDIFEYGCSILSCSFSTDSNVYYCVGTAYVTPGEKQPRKGQILVLKVVDRELQLRAKMETLGAVYSLNAFNGKLLAAIDRNIQLYKWTPCEDGGSPELQPECVYPGHVLALHVCTHGDLIVVGDAMKSITLLSYKQENGGAIEQLACDYDAKWMSAVAILNDDTYLGAQNNFNLFTVRKNSGGAIDEERSRLQEVGEYHLGEYVTRFRRGWLVPPLPDSNVFQIPPSYLAQSMVL